MASKPTHLEEHAAAAAHYLTKKPYRMIVYDYTNQHAVHLYRVAGSESGPLGAAKALKEAHRVHQGECFYCGSEVKHDQLTIDHVTPVSSGGREELANLLIACKPCNSGKGNMPIEGFHPEAGREWLTAWIAHIENRLNQLGPVRDARYRSPEAKGKPKVCAPPQPKPGAAAGP